jgi:phosphatidylserine decarboxylase
MRIPFAREGMPFFLPPLVAGGLAVFPGGMPLLGAPLVGLGLFLLWFFRDPERTPAGGDSSIVAPADGRIVRLRPTPDGGTVLSVFLSPLDVHVNRSPVSGKLAAVDYRPGRFRPAYAEAASHENEQLRLTIEGDRVPLEMREITGVLVRRIVLWKKVGDRLARGERIGIMKFGSRVDLVLPPGVRVLVAEGDRVRGAETIVAEVDAA